MFFFYRIRIISISQPSPSSSKNRRSLSRLLFSLTSRELMRTSYRHAGKLDDQYTYILSHSPFFLPLYLFPSLRGLAKHVRVTSEFQNLNLPGEKWGHSDIATLFSLCSSPSPSPFSPRITFKLPTIYYARNGQRSVSAWISRTDSGRSL